MKTNIKKSVQVGVVVLGGGMALGLGGCNMISGIGKDIQEISANTKAFIEGDKKQKPAASQAEPKKKSGWFG